MRIKTGGKMKNLFITGMMALSLMSGLEAKVTDTLSGDKTETYLNIEFSAKNEFAIVMIQNTAQDSDLYEVYLSRVDSRGNLRPVSGKGHLIGKAPMLGMPQWGEDKSGPYAVMLNLKGEIVFIRPNGSKKPQIKTYQDNFKSSLKKLRAFPYPSKNKNSDKRVVTYQIRNQRGGLYTQVIVDLSGASAKHEVLHEEKYLKGRMPGPIVSFARWVNDDFKLTYGAYKDGCTSPNFKKCPTQLKMLTLDKTLKASFHGFVTKDNRHKVDAFPIKEGSSLKLFAGIDLTENGGEYIFDDKTKNFNFVQSIKIDPNRTKLIKAGAAQSMEPFIWNNQMYLTYNVIEQGLEVSSPLATSYPSEVWVYNTKTKKNCMVNEVVYEADHPLKRTRVDAEPVITGAGKDVTLYYHSSHPIPYGDDLVFDLRKITLGNKGAFDKNCGQ